MMAAFTPGSWVRIRDDWPEARGPVHIRTPHYIRGARGRIARALGDYPNPEDLAFGRRAARVPLYHVAFVPNEIWADAHGEDEIMVEVYEHWLEPIP
ncbi:MAG: nitrile hydratase subunit beta [Acetobacteraceae bacterium]|nr:nitrile hydratase subunit beta [Acetobacteraceae bacterium]